MHIAKSSAKIDPFTPFPNSPNILLITTRKRVTLRTPPCGILKSVCLLCEMDLPTLSLIHLSLISFLMNFIIVPCIPMFFHLFKCILSVDFVISYINIEDCCRFLLSPDFLDNFFVVFDIKTIVLLCFLK